MSENKKLEIKSDERGDFGRFLKFLDLGKFLILRSSPA